MMNDERIFSAETKPGTVVNNHITGSIYVRCSQKAYDLASAWLCVKQVRELQIELFSSKMKFAPLVVPPHRRLETLSTALTISIFFVFIALFFYCMMKPITYPVLIPYLIWIYFDEAPDRSGRRRVMNLAYDNNHVGIHPKIVNVEISARLLPVQTN